MDETSPESLTPPSEPTAHSDTGIRDSELAVTEVAPFFTPPGEAVATEVPSIQPPTDEPIESVDPLSDLVQRLESQIVELRSQVEVLGTAAERLKSDESARAEQIRLRETLLDKLEAAKPNFHMQLLRPFVTRLANLADSICDWERSPPADADGIARCLGGLSLQIREMLGLHGIQEVRPAESDSLDTRYHYVAETRPTADPDAHEKVAAVFQHGYLYFGQHDRTNNVVPNLIRPARVASWKYEAPATQPLNEPPPAADPQPSA